jgi:exodeoxyribonuclease VII large subunit
MDDFDEIAYQLASPDWDDERAGLRVTPATLSASIRDVFRDAGLVDVVLSGTVTGLHRRRRVVAFELSETLPGETSPLAVMPAVAFGAQLEPAGCLRQGSTVLVAGHLEWRPSWGQLRVVCDHIEVLADTSAETASRDRLVRDLIGEGLFSRQTDLTVPARPRVVGLITSQGSAGEADVRASLPEGCGVRLDVRYAPMSGPSATSMVARRLESFTRGPNRPDVIVIARGGGARSDMNWADAEGLARTIATSPIPVWTALGHATDQTVADQVANRSCASPAAAAGALGELVAATTHRERLDRTEAVHATRMAELRLNTALVIVVVIALAVAVSLLG